jgi:hypothetical protein
MTTPDLLDTSSSSDAPHLQQQQQLTASPDVPPTPAVVVDPVTTFSGGDFDTNHHTTSSSRDSTGVPYFHSLFGSRRNNSSPLASMDSSSSPTASDSMKMGSFPPPPPASTEPPLRDSDLGHDDDDMSDNDHDDELRNDIQNSYKKSCRSHDSRRVWYCVGGAIFLVVLIAAIAGGAVTSSKNKKEAAAANNTGSNRGSINIPLNPTNSSADGGGAKSELYLFIESLLPNGGVALHDGQSYQSLAVQFLESTHDVNYSLERVTQRFVLACIYHATHAVKTTYTDFALGENSPVFPWLNSDGWLEIENECEWFGIRCNNVTGLVEAIDLHENLLTGSFPPETALLAPSLLVLDLEENIIYNAGNEGLNWLGELVNLQELNIAKTSFQYDGIPTVLGQLVNLVELDVSYSLFFGPLHEQVFENLKKLQFLNIGGNSYNSSLPASIGRLDSLLYLYAEYTDITGDLSFLTTAAAESSLSSIYELWVDRNPGLTSTIPTQIGQFITLASLSLTDCDLHGQIPTEMGNLVNMKQMWLYGNRLTGDIPSTLGNMIELDRLELEDNGLQGEMPAQVCANVYPRGRLEVLEADCDEASGKISCNATSCCTCCGPECAVNNPQTLRDSGAGSGGTSSSGARDPNTRKRQRRLDYFHRQQEQHQHHS